MQSFLENTEQHVERAASALGLSGSVVSSLSKPKNVFEFKVPLVRDDGKTHILKAWRVQHNDARGPFKGGIRFHPSSNLAEVSALASLMTWKTALVGIPYGGAKGAVTADSKQLSMKELEAVSRSYVRKLFDVIGPKRDIPAPDVGTTPQIMAWMVDEYSKLSGHFEPTAFTGKPMEVGGSFGRDTATGFGGAVVLREFLKSKKRKSKVKNQKLTVAVQGFGAVGSAIARLLAQDGYKIVAVSDSRAAIQKPEGIDVEELAGVQEDRMRKRLPPCTIEEAAGGKCRVITNEELLRLDVDILVPAALENVVTAANAGRVGAGVILELANGPVDDEAEKLLAGRGVVLIPDILANSGGVVGSYFEWVQGLARFYWDEEEVFSKISRIMTRAFEGAAAEMADGGSLREACYRLAVRRVAEAMRLRGWI